MKTMKKLRLILVAIILTGLILLVANKVNSSSGELPLDSLGAQVYDKSTGNYCYKISINTLAKYNNYYCVEHGAWMPDYARWMYVATEVKIEGNVATINGEETCEGEFNNILGAILCEGELGYGPSPNHYNESQIGLYYYWNDWLDEVYEQTGSRHGMEPSGSNDSISNKYNASEIFEWYKSCARQKAYNVTLYFMKVNASPHVQNLIVVEREEPTPLNIDIPVEKKWIDGNNKFNTRGEITVELLANDSPVSKLTLNKSNNWKATFEDLPVVDEDEDKITYTIREIDSPPGYESTTNQKEHKITNILLTQVKVVKQWDDKEDLDEYRPSSLKVTLYSNGISTGKTVILNEQNNWTATFDKLLKYDKNGKEINYTVKEEKINKYEEPEYSKTEDSNNGYITWTIKNTHIPHYDGYVEISGKVWSDGEGGKSNNINGTFGDPEDKLLEGITVRLKYIDGNGKHQLFNTNLPSIYETKTNSKGEYVIRVNYDNSKDVYKLFEDVATVNKKLETAYVEFEYDGMKYTTVASTQTGENTSKAIENETSRNNFDKNHSKVTTETTHPDTWTDKNIIASTNKVVSYEKQNENRDVIVKYCNGNGTYIRTNPEGAWKDILPGTRNLACNSGKGHKLRSHNITVQRIPNINLGLFEREQPDVAIFSDLTKVEVTMNNQKYTYLYGVKGDDNKDVGLQVKFQNKGTYTYRRPVNPADIAYLQEKANNDKMSVLVTYQVKVANLSTTLPIKLHTIINSFDSQYTLENGWAVVDKEGFKQAVSGDLNMVINPQTESSAIELTYKVSMNAIINLLNQNATLNNAVEIGSFSTLYGVETLYAQQGSGARNEKPYGAYDYDSKPGNANIKLKPGEDGINRLYSTDENGNIIPINKMEDDTDIAPSFVLCKDEEPKTLSGTIWEDKDSNIKDNERLGNGQQDDSEQKVENIKIELYDVNGNKAKLYNKQTQKLDRDATVFTETDGSYKLDGVVTGEYYLKITYGDDTEKLQHEATTMDGGRTKVNARNYKSTIIKDDIIKTILNKDYSAFTDQEKKWHITHNDGFSVAVDNMKERLELETEDLTYGNFDKALNMTAYTKPFATQVEFESTGTSQVDFSKRDQNTIFGDINVSTNLDKLDFGIAERPREDIYAQKTITYFKVILENGQVLTEGNPTQRNANINYAKMMGFDQKINSGEDARKALEKQILIEMDTELMQGAKLDIEYGVTITNNSEIDYDHGNLQDEDYQKEFSDTNKKEYDKFITKNAKANYYYYGNSNGLDKTKVVVRFIDYLNKNLEYTDNGKWTAIDANKELYSDNNKIISDEASAELDKYKALISNSKIVTIASGETSEPIQMLANKILANKDENVYDNGVEILSIDGKSARTIQESKSGEQIIKSYKPGTYIPSLSSSVKEQDDDRIRIIISPPTGVNNYIITYIITGLFGLVLVAVGVIFIKRKVLNK